jgi:hypothetical protein
MDEKIEKYILDIVFATRYPENINWQIWNRLSVLSSAWKYQFS